MPNRPPGTRTEDLPGGGLRLHVHAPARPRLRIEIAGTHRFWVGQDTRPLLLAEVARWNDGVHYRRIAPPAPILPPITAALARTGPSWPHRYASWLQTTPGPLHAGWWSLLPWRPSPDPRNAPAVWRHEVAADHPDGYLDWTAGWQGVLPLRPLPATADGRVKAYRKLARDGTLPPLLVWWVSGLDGVLLLDGHARLSAALAEDLTPPALELSLAPGPAGIDEQVAHLTRQQSLVEARLERDARAGRTGVDSATRAHQWRFGALYARLPAERERTRAWPLPGGSGAWERARRRPAP